MHSTGLQYMLDLVNKQWNSCSSLAEPDSHMRVGLRETTYAVNESKLTVVWDVGIGGSIPFKMGCCGLWVDLIVY